MLNSNNNHNPQLRNYQSQSLETRMDKNRVLLILQIHQPLGEVMIVVLCCLMNQSVEHIYGLYGMINYSQYRIEAV